MGAVAGQNPQLSSLVQAQQTAGLTQTLDDPNASLTVFAPSNAAFQALPAATRQQVLSDKAKLTQVLNYHVVPQRYSAAQLANADSVTTAQGGTLTFEASGCT